MPLISCKPYINTNVVPSTTFQSSQYNLRTSDGTYIIRNVVHFFGDRFITAGFTGSTGALPGKVATITDPAVWPGQASILPSYLIEGAAWNGANTIVLAAHPNGTGNQLPVSTDGGASWGNITTRISAPWNTIAYGNGLWLIASLNGSALDSSPDLVTWTARVTSPGYSGTPTNTRKEIAFGNGVFVVVTGANTVKVSANTASWTAIDTGTTTAYNSWKIRWTGTQFYILRAGSPTVFSSRVATSPDGYNWTNWDLPSPPPATNYTDLIFGNGIWLLLTSSGHIFASTDLVNWTHNELPSSNPVTYGAYGNGNFLLMRSGYTTKYWTLTA